MQNQTQNYVVQGGNATPLLLTVSFDDSLYNVSNIILDLPASAVGLALTATKDNYVDVHQDTDGPAYVITPVTIGDPAPAIVGMRLWKLNTDATHVTVSVDMRTLFPTGSEQLDNSAVVTRTIKDGNVTAAKLANTAVTPGSYAFGTFTVDAQGRVTLASSPTDIVAPANKDVLMYDTGSGKWKNKAILGNIFPAANAGDIMRYVGGAWINQAFPTGQMLFFVYDYVFADVGGAIGTILLDDFLPAGSVIMADQVTLEVAQIPTSAGAATIKWGVEGMATNQLDAVRNFNAAPYPTLNGVDRAVQLAKVIKIGSADKKVSFTIAGADLTAGAIRIFIPLFVEPTYT